MINSEIVRRIRNNSREKRKKGQGENLGEIVSVILSPRFGVCRVIDIQCSSHRIGGRCFPNKQLTVVGLYD